MLISTRVCFREEDKTNKDINDLSLNDIVDSGILILVLTAVCFIGNTSLKIDTYIC
jgi:hypothetical protein